MATRLQIAIGVEPLAGRATLVVVPPVGFEPTPLAPEASALIP